MSLTNPNTPVSQQDLQDFYHKLLPYMGGSFEAIANKFSKGDMYSTEERMIGQWIDGKPLYQKTIVIQNPSVSGRTSITSVDFTNCIIKKIEGYAIRVASGVGNIMYPLNSYEGDTYYANVFFDEYKGQLAYSLTFSGNTCSELCITVQYTKTTDSPISIGDDTDYSTEEKIVGTWIDGSPVYQKTVYNTTLSSIPNNNWVTYCTIENIKDLILFKFMRAKNDGGTLGVFNDICGSTNGSNVTCISRTTALTLDYSKSYAILQYTKTTD